MRRVEVKSHKFDPRLVYATLPELKLQVPSDPLSGHPASGQKSDENADPRVRVAQRSAAKEASDP